MSSSSSSRVPGPVVVGVSGRRQNAAVSVCVNGEVAAFCEQERVTRVRGIGLRPGSLPAEALAAALGCVPYATEGDIRTYATAEPGVDLPPGLVSDRFDHHHAHAATAWGLSNFDSAAVLICDHHTPEPLTTWVAGPGQLKRQDWPAVGESLTALYADAALLFGFPAGQEHRLEALARLGKGEDAGRLSDLVTYRDGVISAAAGWRSTVSDWLGEASTDRLRHQAQIASAFQRHLGLLLLDVAGEIRKQTNQPRLCLGGGLFYNTYFTTLVRQAGIFDDVFTAPNPGNAGTALGAALLSANGDQPRTPKHVSPFLGPEYSSENIKRTLDNCKLRYEYLDEQQVIDTTVDALVGGQLVGWFQGRMEWGHRALGNRSILASPLSPHVLDNLNVYLKQREHHRAYGVSVPVETVPTFFDGPPASRFMEYEYRPHDPERFRHVMPAGTEAVRVQTIGPSSDVVSARYRRLHERVGETSGVPVLVNTSFNGFSEPMVCSPRDAIRVFFGTGLDLLVLDRFVVRK